MNNNNSDIQFLSGGGEMGKLTREKDWSKTSLGAPQSWPQSLRTTLSILLNSKFPMFLFWGPELICFYNDAYRPSLGKEGKHPAILGGRGEEYWTEIWHIIKPLIDQVLAGGEASWSEDQLIPIYRNGKIEDVYWTFSYSPVNDESGTAAGVFVTCSETTEKINIAKNLEESNRRFLNNIKHAPVAMCVFKGPDHIVEIANELMLELWGKTESEISGKPIFIGLPEAKGQGLEQIIDNVFNTGQKFVAYEHPVILPRNGNLETVYINFTYEPLREADGTISGIMAVATDITLQVNARKQIELSEARFRSLVTQSPMAMVVLKGPEHIIEIANKAMLKRWNKTAEEIENRRLDDVFPEIKGQKFPSLMDEVYSTGKVYQEMEALSYLKHDEGNKLFYVDFEYSPLIEPDGKISGVIATVTDVTEKVISRKKIEDSEARYHNLIYSSPSAIGILYGEDLVITIANEAIIEIWGKGKEIMGKAYFEALPELAEQGYREIFAEVYKTGKPFNAVETPVHILQNGKMQLKYYNFLLYAQRNLHGDIDAIGIIATEVTSQALFNNQIKESEKRFRLLADSMPQQVWTADTEGKLNYFNQSVFDYAGMTPEQINKEGWITIVHPDDMEENVKQWMHAIATGKNFLFEHRFRRYDGEYRWQLSRAVPQKDEHGNIQMWVGTSTDIQDQKNFSHELEKQVLLRTNEIEQKNIDLEKMNKELQSFAYISSHDLQEPLRKIQTFSNMILDDEFQQLSERGKDFFRRITRAANRMQLLIQDLLAYSRTATAERNYEVTNLTTIIEDVKEELKEELEQKNAVIEIDEACDINIITFQFRQLMHNLISNSLKFSIPGTTPLIKIKSELNKGLDKHYMHLFPGDKYCHIRISDNGIGFDKQFSDKIFELFQRLHGRDMYQGTGIGLAIVKKIVENHSGIITANAEVNKGAEFDIYIPSIN